MIFIPGETGSKVMIISHRHKFIFIHVPRTAGRSLTIDLESHCGPKDIITPSGDSPGRNHEGWHRHSSAREIRERLGRRIYEDYFVFTVERDPWDKTLSTYWSIKGYIPGEGGRTEQVSAADRIWRKASGYPWSFNTWVKYRVCRSRIPGFRRPFGKTFGHYTDERGNVIVDAIFRYEYLENHVGILAARLGLPLKLRSKEGGGTRPDKRDYVRSYSPWSREYISGYYAKEIALMGYAFGSESPDEVVVTNSPIQRFGFDRSRRVELAFSR